MLDVRELQLSLPELEISAFSYVDPNGFVFHHREQIYRAVYKDTEAFYRNLFDDGTIEKLVSDSCLVPSTLQT